MSGAMAGKRVIVTGGAGSLGRALCDAFLAEGACVGFTATEEKRARETAGFMATEGQKPIFAIADFTEPESAGKAISELAGQLGGCDVLINNAAIGIKKGLRDASATDWMSSLSVNVVAPYFAARAAAKVMGRGGVIIGIASEMATLASAKSMIYPTSKAALVHLSKCLAAELAPRGIRVVTVSPGAFLGEMLHRSLPKGTPEDRLDEITRIADNVPLGHIVHPEQIAQTVLFVASEAAAYITGTDIAVDGGTSMPRRIDPD